ncbi:MAG: rhamnose/proton symporter RhaT [Bacteroidales bacterium]|jgi:L-rhamnose-H+ transport protein|nr:rhamnose/proton symporter RhaT [Bacteroidales bacterium]
MTTGILFIIMAGIFSGTFALPFKFNKGWMWENNWLIWSFTALLVAPWVAALLTIPELFTVLQNESGCLYLVTLFGLIWGIGSIMFGKGLHILGISLALPIMQGLINSIGTIMPVIFKDPAKLLAPSGIKLLAGVSVIIFGIILYSIAGSRKEKNLQNNTTQIHKSHSNFKKGLLICILAGIFGPMINFAFVFGKPLQEQAIATGASTVFSANAIWCIVLTAGFVINALECIRLFHRNSSRKCYKIHTGRSMTFAILGGTLWYFSIMFYGMGSNSIGEMGTSIGWAIMQSTAIIAGNVAGIAAGEWKGADRNSIIPMIAGLALLIIGIIVIAY